MISAISSWAQQIIIAVMLATIFEMILPDSKNKKYVKTIIGLYILFTIISPIIKNFADGDISFASSEYLIEMNEISSSYQKFDNVTNGNIQDTYLLSLKQDIQGKLNKKGYIAATINIEIEKKNTDNCGQINSLSISLSKKPKNEDNKTNNSITVNKIQVNNTTTKNENVSTKINDTEIKELKEYLSEEYGVEINNIKLD